MSSKEHGLASPIVLKSNRVPTISLGEEGWQTKAKQLHSTIQWKKTSPFQLLYFGLRSNSGWGSTIVSVSWSFECVEHLNVGRHARRCYGRNGNVALASWNGNIFASKGDYNFTRVIAGHAVIPTEYSSKAWVVFALFCFMNAFSLNKQRDTSILFPFKYYYLFTSLFFLPLPFSLFPFPFFPFPLRAFYGHKHEKITGDAMHSLVTAPLPILWHLTKMWVPWRSTWSSPGSSTDRETK